jgi:NADH-quinone oxidoreductase subunit C
MQQQLKIAEKIANDLRSKLKEIVVKVEGETRISIEVSKEKLLEIASYLKELGFDHVKSVTGTDYPEEEKIQIVYHVSSYSSLDLAKMILALKTYVTYKDPGVKSLYKIWESVWTGERETYEMLGVKFEDHPDLRRLFLPEDFEGVYPLRKSYKIRLEGLFVDREVK